ncbi:MAG: DUF3108 domain-containing protein [Candidatus Sedimenticola sp. 6PFRAG7]
MITRRHIPHLLWAGLMLLASTPLCSSPGTGLTPFSAEYSLSRDNTLLGKVIISLELTPTGDYQYHARTVTTGLVSLFRDDEITEQSIGQVHNGTIRPKTYLYHHKRKEKPRKVSIDFNWRSKRATNRSNNTSWSMKIPGDTQDKFSQQLALMLALSKGSRNLSISVADGGKLKSYRYSADGNERIETAAGTVSAVKIERSKDNRPSDSTLWLSPEFNYLPVKIAKQKKDQQVIMLLNSVTWN